ncbi:site-specific integrase [Rhizobium ruizarguesonis]
MNDVVQISDVPNVVVAYFAAPNARDRFLDFFTAQIRNVNTRRAYAKAAVEFLSWCELQGAAPLESITPIHVAGWIEELTKSHAAPAAKQRLAAVRHLFDWLGMSRGPTPPIPSASETFAQTRQDPGAGAGGGAAAARQHPSRHPDRQARSGVDRPDDLHFCADRRRGPRHCETQRLSGGV